MNALARQLDEVAVVLAAAERHLALQGVPLVVVGPYVYGVEDARHAAARITKAHKRTPVELERLGVLVIERVTFHDLPPIKVKGPKPPPRINADTYERISRAVIEQTRLERTPEHTMESQP